MNISSFKDMFIINHLVEEIGINFAQITLTPTF